MQQTQAINLKAYKEFIETIAKVEYQKLSANYLIEYLELVNIGTQTLYNLFKTSAPEQFNNTYLSTAIKWAIRNEVRRRYKWYSLKNYNDKEENEDLREAVYKTILSIDEMTSFDTPVQIKDSGRTPEESIEFYELKQKILEAMKFLPVREKELIEAKFFQDKKLKEIALDFNISTSRVSRIIQAGLNRIKKELNKQNML
jgi:RNA polymerase sigma factor (sigma-70 family)